MTTVAITGGSGRIATAIRPFLRDRYRVRLLDVRSPAVELTSEEEFHAVDISDIDSVEAALAGADAVVHLAANPSTAGTWSSVLKDNIEGTRAVFEAARRHAIKKVVFASTNHVVGFYYLERKLPIGTDVPIRPDSLYGVSKAFGEALGRYYADAFGMSVICLRIGWFTDRSPSVSALNGLWISPRDIAQVIRLSLETSRTFGIYNATSNNAQHEWDLQSTRADLGFEPRDDVSQIATETDTSPYVDPKAGVLADSP